jgi:DNA-binding phage protein
MHELQAAYLDDILSMMEDAILAGMLDHVVLQRALDIAETAELQTSSLPRSCSVAHSWN